MASAPLKSKAMQDYEAKYGGSEPPSPGLLRQVGPPAPAGTSGGASTTGSAYQQAVKYLTSRLSDGNEDVKDIDPAFAVSLTALLQKASAAGINFKVESGYRTPEQQAALRKARPGDPMVGSVTGSKHVKGQAVDLTLGGGLKMKYNSPEAAWLRENAPGLGLNIPMQSPVGKTTLNEPWHIEPASARQAGTPSGTRTTGELNAGAGTTPQWAPSGVAALNSGTTPSQTTATGAQKAFYDKMLPVAQQVVTKLGVSPNMVNVLLGQWALESAYGTHQAAPNNFAGIGGPGHWKTFKDPAAFGDEVVKYLSGNRYKPTVAAMKSGDISAAVSALGNSGWDAGKYMEKATGPTAAPGVNLFNFLKKDGLASGTYISGTPSSNTGAGSFGSTNFFQGGGTSPSDPFGFAAMSQNPFKLYTPADMESAPATKGYTPSLAAPYKPTDMAPTISMAGKFASMMNPPYVAPLRPEIPTPRPKPPAIGL